MIRINLLPYREFRRRAQIKRDGIGAAVFLVIVGGLLAAGYFHLQGVEQRHQARVDYMQTALNQIKDKLAEVNNIKERRAELTRKLEKIKELQRGRGLPVNILQTLGQAVPEDVSLTSMQQNKGGLQLEGDARSNNAISSFMRRLEASDLFRDPDLQVIQNKRGGGEEIKTF
ncbi:MAG TPA: PilN domain-containing protein, partial [Gammaproteobacteria bacterium]|nr:PilN domain-containing protein [Gammaproteobacteria bacterium]